MKRGDVVKATAVDGAMGDSCASSAPDSRALADWSVRGGPLPAGLSAHIRRCDLCAERVRRINHVHASLTLLRTRALPADLRARANGRALRMLRRAARASAAAKRLLRMRPNLSRWQRAQLHIARASLGAAAALIFMVMRVGVVAGVERTRAAGEQLASLHWDRHIDPDHEWLDPPHLA